MHWMIFPALLFGGPLLLQHPTLSETSIAFSCGGYIWTVGREGGLARQLTTGGHENRPGLLPRWKLDRVHR